MDRIIKTIAEELNVKEKQVESTIKLIDEGNTIIDVIVSLIQSLDTFPHTLTDSETGSIIRRLVYLVSTTMRKG